MKTTPIAFILLTVGIVIGLLLRGCDSNDNPAREHIRYKFDTISTIEYDTVFVDRVVPEVYHDTIWMPSPVFTQITSEGLEENVYQDTSFIEKDYFLFYTADVIGRLNFIDIGYYDNRRDTIQVKTVTNTVTEYVPSKGLYLGIQASSIGDVIPSAMYMKNRSAFIGGYNLQAKQIQVGYFYRLNR